MSKPELFLRLELDSGRLGPGKVALLERIRDTRSLAASARALGMSYKRAWELLAALNTMFDEPVAVSHPGRNVAGATELTPFGERVIALFRAVERGAAQATAAAVAELADASRRAPRDRAPAPARRRAAPPT